MSTTLGPFTLRPHQVRVVRRAFPTDGSRPRLGTAVAHDMGSGKTVTALATCVAALRLAAKRGVRPEAPSASPSPKKRRRLSEASAASEAASAAAFEARRAALGPLAGTCLVVCPKSTTHVVWAKHCETIGLRCLVVESAARCPPTHELREVDVVIVGHANLRGAFSASYELRDGVSDYTDSRGRRRARSGWVLRGPGSTHSLYGLRYEVVAFDEAHALRNADPKCRLHWAARSVCAPVRLALSGTIVCNRPADAASIVAVLSPHHSLADAKTWESSFGHLLRGAVNEFRNHFVDRVKSCECGLPLPPPLPRREARWDLSCMSPSSARLYNAELHSASQAVAAVAAAAAGGEGSRDAGMRMQSAFVRMKQLSFHPWLRDSAVGDVDADTLPTAHSPASSAAVRELLHMRTQEMLQLLSSHVKAVVVSHSVKTLRLMRHFAKRASGDLEGPLFYGGLDSKARSKAIEIFSDENGPRVMYLSLEAGGEGISLTAASAMFFLDAWYTSAKHRQCVARVLRPGQSRAVQVSELRAKGSIADAIYKVHEDKDRCESAIVDGKFGDRAGATFGWRRLGRIVGACERSSAGDADESDVQ